MIESSEDSSYSEHNEDSEYTGDSEEALSDDERVTTIAQSYCPSNQPRQDLRESLDFQQAIGVVTNAPTNDVLADAAGEFFVFLCTEEFVDSQSSSALLVFFCGTLGFSPNKWTQTIGILESSKHLYGHYRFNHIDCSITRWLEFSKTLKHKCVIAPLPLQHRSHFDQF